MNSQKKENVRQVVSEGEVAQCAPRPSYENIEQVINGTWYAPCRWIKSQDSVVDAEITDMTSSAGDWSGYFIVEKEGSYVAIPFSQSNNYPRSGFTLYTGKIIAIGDNLEEVKKIAIECVNDPYLW